MLRQGTIFFIGCFLVLFTACSKGDPGTPETPNPPNPPVKVFTISNLTYSPSVVPIKPGAPTFQVTGTVSYTNAGGGLSKLRLKTSAGFDTTISIEGGIAQTSGTVSGFFELTRPITPVQFTFDIWLVDLAGKESNKLSGTITILVDDTGQNWHEATIDILRVFNDIGWYNNQFLAVTGSGSIGRSPDGYRWTEYVMKKNTVLNSVTWTGWQYVVVGNEGTIYTSPDGTSWTDRSLGENDNFNWLRSVASNGSIIVAVGETRNDFSINRSELRSVTWTGSQFVAVGIGRTPDNAYPMLLTSPDGLNWTDRSLPTYLNVPLYDVIQAGNKTIAIGYGLSMISTNGQDWTVHEIPKAIAAFSLAWSGNKLLGAGNGIFVTADGINWQQTFPGNTLADNFKCASWDGYKYVVAGKYERTVMISP